MRDLRSAPSTFGARYHPAHVMKTCEEHGLGFDPATQLGCVVCRRQARRTEASDGGTARRIVVLLVVGGLLIGGAVWFLRRHLPAMIAAKDAETTGGGATGAGAAARPLVAPIAPFFSAPSGAPPPGGHPTMIVMHGVGGSGARFTYFAQALNEAGIAAVVPTGPVVVESDHYSWSDDLGAMEVYLANAIDFVASQQRIDRTRLMIGGYSAGAWLAIAIAARRPDTYHAVLAFAPVGPREWAFAPAKTDVALTMFAGRDDIAAQDTARAAEASWRARGWTAQIVPYAGGHQPPATFRMAAKEAAAALLVHVP